MAKFRETLINYMIRASSGIDEITYNDMIELIDEYDKEHPSGGG